MYDTIIFDLDGTLLNTLEDLCNSTNYALNKYGFKERTLEEVRTFVGNGVAVLIKRALPENTDEELYNDVLSTFKAHYKEHCNDLTGPYDGIVELLSSVKERGFRTAIVSNKLDGAVVELKKLYFEKYIDVAVGVREDVPPKPQPDMVMNALNALGSRKDTTLYVGDSEVDVMTARNTGLDMVTCLWGFRSRDELDAVGGTNYISHPMELIQWLENRK